MGVGHAMQLFRNGIFVRIVCISMEFIDLFFNSVIFNSRTILRLLKRSGPIAFGE